MLNYCTLFDTNYLTRGLAMYESLLKYTHDFHLYIFSFDDYCTSILKDLNLEKVTIVTLKEFEDDQLLAVKKARTVAEYCWTCTPSVILYSIQNFNLESCTYLDADIYFFSDPSVLIEEMGDKSVLITEHRYTPDYDLTETSGKYCVQFMCFKNDSNGLNVLNWWRDRCLEWCHARFEDGKFGDQKYLDDWTIRFEGVHELQHLGGGMAPWNIQRYNLKKIDFDIVFYHFHGLKIISRKRVELGGYRLTSLDLDTFYKPYLRHLFEIGKKLNLIKKDYDFNPPHKIPFHWKMPIWIIKRIKNKTYNIFPLGDFL